MNGILIGTVLTIVAVAYVLAPLLRSSPPPGGVTPICPECGPRPEADAAFCSNCGRALAPR